MSHPAVVEAAAVGVPDEVKGEALWCFVRARRPASSRPTSCGPSCVGAGGRRSSASRSGPAAVRFTAALPKTRSAKVLRRAIRAAAARRRPRRPVLARGPGRRSTPSADGLLMAIRRRDAPPLIGRRVMLRPLVAVRLRRLAEVRTPQRRLAHPVGAAARCRASPTRSATATRSPRAAAPASASASSAPATASASSSTASSPARSTSRPCSGARSRAPTSATGSTRARPATGYMPEALVVLFRSRSRTCTCTGSRSRSSPATPPAGGWSRSSAPRRGRRPALPRDQRRVGGPRPLRHHRRGVGAAARAAAWID